MLFSMRSLHEISYCALIQQVCVMLLPLLACYYSSPLKAWLLLTEVISMTAVTSTSGEI